MPFGKTLSGRHLSLVDLKCSLCRLPLSLRRVAVHPAYQRSPLWTELCGAKEGQVQDQNKLIPLPFPPLRLRGFQCGKVLFPGASEDGRRQALAGNEVRVVMPLSNLCLTGRPALADVSNSAPVNGSPSTPAPGLAPPLHQKWPEASGSENLIPTTQVVHAGHQMLSHT